MNVHVILLFCYLQYTFAYKNVVLVHGIMSEARKLQDMKRMIEQAHPGTNVTVVHLYPELQSVVPLQIQLKLWKEKIQTIMDESIDGIHLICHSQGKYSGRIADFIILFWVRIGKVLLDEENCQLTFYQS